MRKAFTVPILDDAASERNETVRLTLSSPQGGARLGIVKTATLTIVDNDHAAKTAVLNRRRATEGLSGR